MRAVLTLLFCGICGVWAQAGTFSFSVPVGSTAGGLPVDARAVFSISNGMIDVTLTNLQANPRSATQLLSDLSFNVGHGSLAGTLSTSMGQEIFVNSNGTFSTGSSVATGWALGTSGTTTASLNVLGTSTAPKHLIIGPPG